MDDEIELDYDYDEPCYPTESSSESEEEEVDPLFLECVDEVEDENGVNRAERLKRIKSTDKQQRDDRRRGQRVSRPRSSARRVHDSQPETAYTRVQISSRESPIDRRQRVYARSHSPRDPINERSAMKQDKSDSEMAGRKTRSPGSPSHGQPCKIKAAAHSFFPSPPERDSQKSVQRHQSGNSAQREMPTIRHEPPRVPPLSPKRRLPPSPPERRPPSRLGMISYHSGTNVERNSPPVRFFSLHPEPTNRPSLRREPLPQPRVSELHDSPSTDGYRSRDQLKSNLGRLGDEMKREANEKTTSRDGHPSASPNDKRTRKDEWKSASRENLRRTDNPEMTRGSTSKESSFSPRERNTHQRLARIQAADTKKFLGEQRLIQEDQSFRNHGVDNEHDTKPRISAVNARQSHMPAISSRKLDLTVEEQSVKDRKTQTNVNRNIVKTQNESMVSSKHSTNQNLKKKALVEDQRSVKLKVANEKVDQSLTRVARILSPVKHPPECSNKELPSKKLNVQKTVLKEKQGSKNHISEDFEVSEATSDAPNEKNQSNLFLTFSTPQRALDKEEKNRLLMDIAKKTYQGLKKTGKCNDPDGFIREITPPIDETDSGALTPIYSVDSPLSPNPLAYFDEKPLSPSTTNDSIEHDIQTMFTHSMEELVEPEKGQKVLDVIGKTVTEKPKQKAFEPLVKVERKRIEGPSSILKKNPVAKRVHAVITGPSPEPPIKQRSFYAQKANQDVNMRRKSIDMAMSRSQQYSVYNHFHSSLPSTSQLSESVAQNGISNKRSMFVLASETRAKKRERSFVYENDFVENNRRNVILYDEPAEPPISVFIPNAQPARREVVYADYQDEEITYPMLRSTSFRQKKPPRKRTQLGENRDDEILVVRY